MDELRRAVEKLKRCPQAIIKSEIKLFVDFLENNAPYSTRLEILREQQSNAIGSRAGQLVSDPETFFSNWSELTFLASLEAKALFAYLVLQGMRDSTESSTRLGNNIAGIGTRYGRRNDLNTYIGTPTQSERFTSLEVFVSVFFEPLVDYFELTSSKEMMILETTIRYKRHREWFAKERMESLASEGNRQVETRLKRDFHKYLFENQVDFLIEPADPGEGGRPDVVVFQDGSKLPVEAKVFDGRNRDGSYLKRGYSQTIEYARDFGEARGYLLIYNIAQNTRLVFADCETHGLPYWSRHDQGKEIIVFTVDLGIDLPPSQAADIKTVSITLG